jgi:hypothetical protein
VGVNGLSCVVTPQAVARFTRLALRVLARCHGVLFL